MKVTPIAAFALIAVPAIAQTIPGDLSPELSRSTVEGPFVVASAGPPQASPWVTFSGGVSVNGATGEVKIPEGISPDDAAKQFWNAVAQMRGKPLPFPQENHQ